MTSKGRGRGELKTQGRAQVSPADPFVIRHSSFIIGLDAGGTKTVCLLARAEDGAVVGRGVGGAGNIRAAGAERVAQSLTEAIAGAFAAAGWPPGEAAGQVAVAAIGAAGAARDD